MTQAHVNFEHVIRPPDDTFSELEGSSFMENTRPLSHSPSLPQDDPDPENTRPLSPSPSLPVNDPELEGIPEHFFDIKSWEGKSGAMKGKMRETVTLVIRNYIFRKRTSQKNGNVRFGCNACEKMNKHLYAVALINEEGRGGQNILHSEP